jgi:hypothetical protein
VIDGLGSLEADGDSKVISALAKLAYEFEVTLPMGPDVDLFTNAQLLVLGSPFLDPNNTGGAELKHPTFLSGSGGLRLHF